LRTGSQQILTLLHRLSNQHFSALDAHYGLRNICRYRLWRCSIVFVLEGIHAAKNFHENSSAMFF
jgi:hypothetical protein